MATSSSSERHILWETFFKIMARRINVSICNVMCEIYLKPIFGWLRASKYLIHPYSHPALSGESKTRCFKCPKELYALVSQHFYKLFSMHFTCRQKFVESEDARRSMKERKPKRNYFHFSKIYDVHPLISHYVNTDCKYLA